MGELIDRESLLQNLNRFAPEHHNALVELLIRKQPPVDAIPVDCIRARAHEATGPEGTYLRRLLEEWETANAGEEKP